MRIVSQETFQVHETGSWLLWFVGRLGPIRGFLASWLSLATLVASYDSLTTSPFDVPSLAIVLGSVHLLAAAHNTALHAQIRVLNKDEIKERSRRLGEYIFRLNRRKRISYVLEREAFELGVLFLAVSTNYFIYFNNPLPCGSQPVSNFWTRIIKLALQQTPCTFYSYLAALFLLGLAVSFFTFLMLNFVADAKLLESYPSPKT